MVARYTFFMELVAPYITRLFMQTKTTSLYKYFYLHKSNTLLSS